MVITTKVGDKGKTNILFGHQVNKADHIMDVCGTVDELNASLGVARAHVIAPNMRKEILGVQHKLFVIGAEMATKEEDLHKLKRTITKEDVESIELEINLLERYNDIDNWFVPGESASSAHLELARTIARRLERLMWKFEHHNEDTRVYINRLSDYLWLLAQKEEYYLRGQERKTPEQVTNEQQTTI